VCYIPFPSLPLWFDHPNNILWSVQWYEAPHAFLSSLLQLPLSQVKIFSLISCSHTPPICVLPLV
jgi:hypothetical protein